MKKKAYFLYAVYILALLVATDFSAGLLYERFAPPLGRRNIKILLGQLDWKTALNEQPHPYMLWQNTPEFLSANGIRITDNLGYRNKKDLQFAKDARTLRILALGGSTTWGDRLDDPDDTWPGQLEKLLNDKIVAHSSLDRIEVINGGLQFGTSAELLLHYLFRDRYLHPDFVILHVGGNDAIPLLFDDYDPEYVSFRPGWTMPTYSLRKGEGFLLRHSNIIKSFYASWLSNSVAAPAIDKLAERYDLAEDYYMKNATRHEPIGFERNLTLLLRNILSDGATPILFPFVWTSDEQFAALKGEAAKRAANMKKMRKALVTAIHKDEGVMRRLSEKFRIPLITLSPKVIPTDYFLDHCHLSKDGEAIKATFLANHICTLIPNLACSDGR